MEAEASLIARKIRERIIIENRKPLYAHRIPKESVKTKIAKERSAFKTSLAIVLMALSVGLTQVTLLLVQWSKKLEA